MPFDDDPDDERPVPDRLLPPEDRLWRHPSEVAAGFGPRPLPMAAPTPSRSTRRTPAMTALAGACLAGAVVAFGAMWLTRPTRVVERELPAASIRSVPPAAPVASFAVNPVPTESVAQLLGPSVARIQVERDGAWSSASAVWIDDRGTLAAAVPAVWGATRIRAVGTDGVTRPAELVGVDPATGVAALVVRRTGGDPVLLADHDVRPGEPAAVAGAVGADAGGDRGDATVAGVIVRSTAVRSTVGDLLIHDGIQLDRIVPDDAIGGALVDAEGGLLGLVVGNSTERSLGTAIPARTAVDAATELRDHGEVRRAWLGVKAVDLDPDAADALALDGGADLTEVTPDSPAAAAGLRPGDVVTAVDGTPVDDASDLVVTLRRLDPGDDTVIELRRDGKVHEMTATLGG